jgi:hypothetical protein
MLWLERATMINPRKSSSPPKAFVLMRSVMPNLHVLYKVSPLKMTARFSIRKMGRAANTDVDIPLYQAMVYTAKCAGI